MKHDDLPCHLVEKNGTDCYCERHAMYHCGPLRLHALDTGETGKRWRAIWSNLKENRQDESLPEPTAHITDYDDCPHRNGVMDKTTCGCISFFCKLHETCTTQKRTGLKLCQECSDYPKKHSFIAGRDYHCGSTTTGKHGIVIGSFGMPGVVELSIAATRRACGNVPILISDDCTPETQGRKRILELPRKWNNVSLIMNGENLGHAPGDVRAFRNGLRWAQQNGIKYLCKLSQRFIFTGPQWLQSWCDEMEKAGAAVSSQRAVHLNMQFPMRTECVFMDVERCTRSATFMMLLDPPGGKIPTSAEHWVSAAAEQGDLGDMMRCRKIPVDRFEKRSDVVWHNSDSSDDYHETENAYHELARELGVDLGPEFSGAGWHVLAAMRPDTNYRML